MADAVPAEDTAREHVLAAPGRLAARTPLISGAASTRTSRNSPRCSTGSRHTMTGRTLVEESMRPVACGS